MHDTRLMPTQADDLPQPIAAPKQKPAHDYTIAGLQAAIDDYIISLSLAQKMARFLHLDGSFLRRGKMGDWTTQELVSDINRIKARYSYLVAFCKGYQDLAYRDKEILPEMLGYAIATKQMYQAKKAKEQTK